MDQQRLALFRPFSAGSLKKFYRLIIIWKAKKRKKKTWKMENFAIRSDQIRLDCTWVYKIRENSEIFKDGFDENRWKEAIWELNFRNEWTISTSAEWARTLENGWNSRKRTEAMRQRDWMRIGSRKRQEWRSWINEGSHGITMEPKITCTFKMVNWTSWTSWTRWTRTTIWSTTNFWFNIDTKWLEPSSMLSMLENCWIAEQLLNGLQRLSQWWWKW